MLRGRRRRVIRKRDQIDSAGAARVDPETDQPAALVDRLEAQQPHRGGRIALQLPSGVAPASLAIVEISTKPFINLVWIGALLMLFGTIMAGVRRAAEQQPAVVRRTPKRRLQPAAGKGSK